MSRLRLRRITQHILVFLIIVGSIFFISDVAYAQSKNAKIICNGKVEKSVFSEKNKTTAKALHKKLNSGKPFVLELNGTKEECDKSFKLLQKQVGKINTMGIQFLSKSQEKTPMGYRYIISKNEANCYKYGVLFMKKLYNYTVESIDMRWEHDKKICSDERELILRIVYECLIADFYKSVRGHAFFVHFPDFQFESSFDIRQIEDRYNCIIKDVRYTFNDDFDNYYDDSGYLIYEFCSFEEFRNRINEDEIIAQIDINSRFTCKQDSIIVNKKPCDMSDAMKIYLIDRSGYFDCTREEREFGMRYGGIGYTAIYFGPYAFHFKEMYKNTAKGVCVHYAAYSTSLFKQLGMTVYFQSHTIGHAWSVVKVKNSKGKTLWIPFDYGIGPAENLDATEDEKDKYLGTEESRYKLYLEGIKGAPHHKNFTWDDFN